MQFEDRLDAGRQLAARLINYAGQPGVIVLALPRGGVSVAAAVAARLDARLDVFLVRKLGVPGHVELAMGSIAEGGATVLNDDVIESFGISQALIAQVTAREEIELARRERLYRGSRPALAIRDRIVILIDDGLATGSTMEVAIVALRRLSPARIVAAVPVAARESFERIGLVADDIVCVEIPPSFRAVGQWYADFSETSDDDVRRFLAGTTG